jgi:hypothetical protein
MKQRKETIELTANVRVHSNQQQTNDKHPELCAMQQSMSALPCPSIDSPHPSLSPQEVVLAQLRGLQSNDSHLDGGSNEGIKLCFAFASPANKLRL